MSWNDAVEKILSREGKPIHYRQLAKKILDERLFETKGKTPETAMYVSISVENKHREEKGSAPRFHVERGIIGLAFWATSSSKTKTLKQLERERVHVKLDLLRRLRQLNGPEFESYLETFLLKLGCQAVELRGGPTDEGIDLICEMSQGINQVKTAVQAKCKQPRNKVGPKDVRLLRDVLPKFGCSQGVLITTSSFNTQAHAAATEANRLPIILIDGERLTELALQHEVGVTSQSMKMYAIDEEFELFSRQQS
jgi:restriction endonuclease Mrr